LFNICSTPARHWFNIGSAPVQHLFNICSTPARHWFNIGSALARFSVDFRLATRRRSFKVACYPWGMASLRIHRHHVKRDLRGFANACLELVWPTRCAGCERLGTLLCDRCMDALPYIDQEYACPRCGAPAGRLVCTECTPIYEKKTFAFSQARCALEFSELTRRIIVAYKDGGERRLAPLLSHILASAIPPEWRRWLDAFTWIPVDQTTLNRRGFDHMELIARALAEQTGLSAAPILVKRARNDQRRLNRAQRRENMAASFSVVVPPSAMVPPSAIRTMSSAGRRHYISPRTAPCTAPQATPPSASLAPRLRNLILIDDVFTTGATLDAASRVLLTSGVREIRVATIARVW
jgi:predicted amidophosphoribosyltransferase